MRRLLLLCLAPRLLLAQFVGVSLGSVSSTVDWQYPPPSSACDFCVSDVSPNANRQSLAPAVVAQWGATRWLGFASEARYTSKGFAVSQPTLNVSYVEVPALLRVGKLTDAQSPVLVFAEAGPAFALRVQCDVESNESDSCRKGAALGQDWRIKWYDVSGVLGVGSAIRFDESLLIIGIRVDRGFVDIGGGQGVPTKNRSTLAYLEWLWAVK